MMTFKNWLNEDSSTFTTSRGSTYEFDAGRSRRNKSLHQYHDISDVGMKEISDRTVFIDQQFAREIGMWGSSSAEKKRIVLAAGKVYLLSWNAAAGKHGMDKIISTNAFSTIPVVGKCPLELWKKDMTPWPWLSSGMEVYRDSHPGSPISQVNDPRA
jgi:hypothetical protein